MIAKASVEMRSIEAASRPMVVGIAEFLSMGHVGSDYYFFAAEGAGVAEGADVAEALGAAEASGAAETAGAAEGAAVAEAIGAAEAAGVAEGAELAAMRPVVPVVRESDGLTITLSDSVTPLRISD